jgi:hypothetical protein
MKACGGSYADFKTKCLNSGEGFERKKHQSLRQHELGAGWSDLFLAIAHSMSAKR